MGGLAGVSLGHCLSLCVGVKLEDLSKRIPCNGDSVKTLEQRFQRPVSFVNWKCECLDIKVIGRTGVSCSVCPKSPNSQSDLLCHCLVMQLPLLFLVLDGNF